MGIKISELPSTSIANANDVFIINQGGTTKKITKDDLQNQIGNPELEERVTQIELDTGTSLELSMNTSTYVLTANLKNKDDTIVSTATVDLPLESLVKDIQYDSTTKEIVFILQDGTTRRIPLSDLISGLQSEITNENKLNSDLVDDTNSTHKFVTANEKTQISTNTTAITNIKDGTEINSFGDVENLLAEQDTEIEKLQTKVTNLEETVNSELEDGVAEGTEITVNDSATADASLDIAGNTGQTQYEGNQLIDFGNLDVTVNTTYSFENDILTVVNTSGGNRRAYANITNLIKNNTGKTLYFVYENIDITNQYGIPIRVLLRYNDSTTESITLLAHSLERSSFLIPSDTSNITEALIYFVSNGSSTSQEASLSITKPMLQFGTETKEYEPYVGGQASPNPEYTQLIHVLKGSNRLRITNKNLFCKENANVFNGYIDANTDKIAGSTTAKSIYIPCKPNTSYMVSKISSSRFRIADILEEPQVGVDIEKKSNNLGTITEYPFTTGNNAKYLFVTIYNSTTDTLSLEDILSSLQIEYGLTVTDYIEGEEQIKTLTLPNGMEMCNIADYRDEFVKDLTVNKWYKNKKILKTIFNGTETGWSLSNQLDVDGFHRFFKAIDNLYINNSEILTLADYLRGIAHANRQTDYENTCHTGGGNFSVNTNVASTKEEWLSYLAEHNLTAYMVLETPVLEEITDTTLIAELDELLEIRTYLGQTNITVEAEDLPPMMTLNYKKSNRALRSEIDTIKARLDLLEN